MLILNVGCGRKLKSGYINIDIEKYEGINYSDFSFIQVDVRDGFPFENKSVCLIRAYQFIEHFDLSELSNLFDEFCRIAAVECELIITFPDVSYIAEESILGGRDFVADENKISQQGVPKGLSVLNYVSSGWGHKIIVTSPLISEMIEQHGFRVDWQARNKTNALIIAVKK